MESSSIPNLLSNLLHHIYNNKFSIFFLIVYFLVFYVIFMMFTVIKKKNEIISNWSEYKCKPYIMPISGFFKKFVVLTF